jgi:hypothetical protein
MQPIPLEELLFRCCSGLVDCQGRLYNAKNVAKAVESHFAVEHRKQDFRFLKAGAGAGSFGATYEIDTRYMERMRYD